MAILFRHVGREVKTPFPKKVRGKALRAKLCCRSVLLGIFCGVLGSRRFFVKGNLCPDWPEGDVRDGADDEEAYYYALIG